MTTIDLPSLITGLRTYLATAKYNAVSLPADLVETAIQALEAQQKPTHDYLWHDQCRLAVEMEREACAQLCEQRIDRGGQHDAQEYNDEARCCANAIRARTPSADGS